MYASPFDAALGGRELCKDDKDRKSQQKTIALVEDLIRQSAVRSAADLMELNVEKCAWSPTGPVLWLEGKKVRLARVSFAASPLLDAP